MTKTARRKPASFRVEDVEIVMPPEPAPLPDVPETQAEVKDLPKLERGLRWGSIFLGALGGLISLLLSLWLYDYVLALIARDDWIGWVAVVLLGLVVVALGQCGPAGNRIGIAVNGDDRCSLVEDCR